MYGAIDSHKRPAERLATGRDVRRPAVTTTLYHLIAGLQDCISSDDDDLLVAVVHHLIGTGRIKVLSESYDRRWDAAGADSDA